MRRPPQTLQDKVLWNLVRRGGNLDSDNLCIRMNMRLNELEPILDDLERQGRISRVALEPRNDMPKQMITFRFRPMPAVR